VQLRGRVGARHRVVQHGSDHGLDLEPAVAEATHEEASGRRLVEQPPGVVSTRERVRQAGVDPVDDGDVRQHLHQLRTLVREQLAPDVVLHEEVGAEGPALRRGCTRAPRPEGGQPQTGCPSPGSGHRRVHLFGGQRGRGAPEHLDRLVPGAPQLVEADLAEVAAGPEAVQRKARLTAGQEHEVQPRRLVADEQLERGGDGRFVVDEVHVVDDEHERLTRARIQIVEEADHDVVGLVPVPTPLQRADPGAGRLHGGRHAAPELGAVPVVLVERQPRGGRRPFLEPRCQQRGLPRPRRRGDDGERREDDLVQQVQQPGPSDVVGRFGGRPDLGSQHRRRACVALLIHVFSTTSAHAGLLALAGGDLPPGPACSGWASQASPVEGEIPLPEHLRGEQPTKGGRSGRSCGHEGSASSRRRASALRSWSLSLTVG
jgi:hypothetical protein